MNPSADPVLRGLLQRALHHLGEAPAQAPLLFNPGEALRLLPGPVLDEGRRRRRMQRLRRAPEIRRVQVGSEIHVDAADWLALVRGLEVEEAVGGEVPIILSADHVKAAEEEARAAGVSVETWLEELVDRAIAGAALRSRRAG